MRILLDLAAKLLNGGEVLRSFTISMTFGMLVGMYSSIIRMPSWPATPPAARCCRG